VFVVNNILFLIGKLKELLKIGAFCYPVPWTILRESLFCNKVEMLKGRSLKKITSVLRRRFLC